VIEFARLLSDWVLVELEPAKEATLGGIIKVGPDPIRIAKVLKAGPGRHYVDKYVPSEVKPGDRFPFFKATSDTKQGRQLAERLPEGQELIRESDILFVIEEGDVEVTC
jgi:co-chaperonin GroES (HSP10)